MGLGKTVQSIAFLCHIAEKYGEQYCVNKFMLCLHFFMLSLKGFNILRTDNTQMCFLHSSPAVHCCKNKSLHTLVLCYVLNYFPSVSSLHLQSKSV
jgi:hypothetical protein